MKTFTLAILPLALISAFSHAAEEKAAEQAEVDTVYVTAEKQLQQSLGVSRISKDDIDKRPAVNDISECPHHAGRQPDRQYSDGSAWQQTPN